MTIIQRRCNVQSDRRSSALTGIEDMMADPAAIVQTVKGEGISLDYKFSQTTSYQAQ